MADTKNLTWTTEIAYDSGSGNWISVFPSAGEGSTDNLVITITESNVINDSNTAGTVTIRCTSCQESNVIQTIRVTRCPKTDCVYNENPETPTVYREQIIEVGPCVTAYTITPIALDTYLSSTEGCEPNVVERYVDLGPDANVEFEANISTEPFTAYTNTEYNITIVQSGYDGACDCKCTDLTVSITNGQTISSDDHSTTAVKIGTITKHSDCINSIEFYVYDANNQRITDATIASAYTDGNDVVFKCQENTDCKTKSYFVEPHWKAEEDDCPTSVTRYEVKQSGVNQPSISIESEGEQDCTTGTKVKFSVEN